MIVDAHGHYNTQEAFIQHASKWVKYEWEKRRYDGMVQAWKRFEEATTVESWIESLNRYGVDKVLLQTAPWGSSDAVAKFIKESPEERFVGLANIDFMAPYISDSVKELERCVKELGLKGVGELYPHIGPWDPGDEKIFPIYAKAEELGVPIMIHLCTEGGPVFNDQRYSDPYLIDPVLRAFPDLNMIICHMAGDRVGALFTLMHARPNLHAEMNGVSTPWYGLFDSVVTPQHIMKKFLERGFGTRLLWSTDVQAPYNSDFEKNKVRGHIKDNHVVKLLEEIGASEEDKTNILGNNAARLFKL